MEICNLLSEDHIFFDLKPGTKKSVIEEFVKAMKLRGLIENEKLIREELLNRESLGSTGLENGIAIPHTLSDEIPESFLALALLKEGIEFEAVDQMPTYVLFLLLGNKNDPGTQLKVLAHICRLVKDTDLIEKIQTAESPREVIEILGQKDKKLI